MTDATTSRTDRPRILLYVQHLLGIGHQKRAATLTRALEAAGFAVTYVSGGFPVRGLDTGPADFVQLPPARAVDKFFKVLVGPDGQVIDDAWRARRRDHLVAIVERLQPVAVITELFPFGRRQLASEIVPMVEAARALPRPALIVSSVRDILVEPPKEERRREMLARARRYYDLVMVHGDPALVPFERTFPLMAEVSDLVRYTGYVVDRARETAPPPGGSAQDGRDEVLVSAGGGAVSEALFRAAIAARALTSPALARRRWRLLVGWNLADPVLDDLSRVAAEADATGFVVERARPDFVAMLGRAALSISQAGYNTLLEVIENRVPAVVVPYAGGLETEQGLRAGLVAERGLVEVVDEETLTAEGLAAAADRALAAERDWPRLDMDGAAASARLLHDRLAARG
jgi:predicted glycosyltransferase